VVAAPLRQVEEAERLAREALTRAEQTDQLDLHAETYADLAEVLRMGGRRAEAANQFARALALYERKGNLVATRQIRARMVSLRPFEIDQPASPRAPAGPLPAAPRPGAADAGAAKRAEL
jgi:tetratricopeptide (TPR) repeat protein